jgi:hypothetical protein
MTPLIDFRIAIRRFILRLQATLAQIMWGYFRHFHILQAHHVRLAGEQFFPFRQPHFRSLNKGREIQCRTMTISYFSRKIIGKGEIGVLKNRPAIRPQRDVPRKTVNI